MIGVGEAGGRYLRCGAVLVLLQLGDGKGWLLVYCWTARWRNVDGEEIVSKLPVSELS